MRRRAAADAVRGSTSPAEELAYITRHCSAAAVVCQDSAAMEKLLPALAALDAGRDGGGTANGNSANGSSANGAGGGRSASANGASANGAGHDGAAPAVRHPALGSGSRELSGREAASVRVSLLKAQ